MQPMTTALPPDDDPVVTPGPGAGVTVTLVHPYQARKRYVCPGCGGPIKVGEGHYVVIPDEADLRRHWHRACWEGEQRRRKRS